MARNRKAFIDYVCTYLDKLLPGGDNGKYMRERLEALSPEQMDEYVAKLESGEEIIPLIAPNLHDNKLTIPNNLKIAKELGLELFEPLRLTDADTGQTYLTNEKYLVMDIPVRRQRQLQRKKTSIPQGVKQVDDLSGQVTGMAKGSKVSMPELQVLYSQELTFPIIELIKYRGGDVKGQQLLYRSLMETGRASQRALAMTPTTVRSTQILSIVLNAMHLSTTLMD
jgi:hypothetical protein